MVRAMASLLKPGKWNPTWIGASMGDRDIDVARGHYTSLFTQLNKMEYTPNAFPHIEIDVNNRMRVKYQDYDFHMRFVFFDTKHMHSYYNKFANGFLWPLMHLTRSPLFYMKSKTFPRPQFEKNDFIQYTSSGVTFANTVFDEVYKTRHAPEKERDVIVWNQDYHLMRISEAYKALLDESDFTQDERCRMHVGQFIHTPFFDIHEIQGLLREDKRKRIKSQIDDPFSESMETVLQKLTWSMLSNDFIAFHTKLYCDNYLEALEEWFPVKIRIVDRYYEIIHQGRVTTVGAIPIGLDVGKILDAVAPKKRIAATVKGESLYKQIKDHKAEDRIIFGGLERCDYTKGLVERLNIFYHAQLGLHKIGKQGMCYQVSSPSRMENEDYKYLQEVLKDGVADINHKLGQEALVHIDQGIDFPQNYLFMKEIDVMMVTPLDDGMNLVAFEYILSQKYKNHQDRGMLLLGTSGAARVLRENGFTEKDGIISINPLNAKAAGEKAVEAIHQKHRISDRLIEYVEREHRVDGWANKNIEAILNSRKFHENG